MSSSHIIFDGEIVAGDTPIIPAESRGLMYGEGVFETLRVYKTRTLFLSKHIARLSRGLDTLGITAPDELKIDSLRTLIFKLLEKQDLLQDDVIVRLQVWRDGGRGYLPDEEAESHFSISASVSPDLFSPPELVIVNRRRIPSESLPSDAKLTNSINYILASREAAKKGGDDALMLTTDNWISETTIANIFWIKDKIVFTPSADCDILPGITRDILIQLVNNRIDLELREGRFNPEDLRNADAVWICNSVRELLSVKKIDSYSFNVEHNLLDELKARFHQFKEANLQPLDK